MSLNITIVIDPKVQAQLKNKKKKCMVLDISKSGGGCCPTYDVADISFKIPEDVTLYHTMVQDDLEIFISKKATVITPVLRFSLEKMGLIKQIVARGLLLKNDR